MTAQPSQLGTSGLQNGFLRPEGELPIVCSEVYSRLSAFLAEEPSTDRLRKVQEQSRISLQVIHEALERYRYELGH